MKEVEVLEKMGELSKIDMYKMVYSDQGVMLKNFDGEFSIDKYVRYKTKDNDGNETVITSILTQAGDIVQFQSDTASRNIDEIMECFGEEDVRGLSLKAEKSTSKGGREFIKLIVI